jgi:4-hydroxy-tetrahydrodipicolinate synthase
MRAPDGRLLPEEQEKLLDLVAPHADALFVSGTNGLCPWLTPDQQKALVWQAVSYCRRHGLDRAVLCGALGNTTPEVAERAQAIAAAGADAVVVYTPYFFRHTDEELVEYFLDLGGRARGVPLVLYNLPQMTKNNLTPVLLRRIVEGCDAYVAIKDSKGDLAQFDGLIPLRDQVNVLAGDEEICHAVLGRCDGCVPAAANVFPLLWRRIMDEAGDPDALERDHRYVMAVKRDVYGVPAMMQVISGILTALQALGVGVGPMPPFLPLDRLEAARGLRERLLATLDRLREFIPDPFRGRLARRGA